MMRVLVATDGSEGARSAAEWLTTLPLPATTDVRVVAVTLLPPHVVEIPSRRDLDTELLEEARRIAADTEGIVRRRWPATEARAIEGDPRDAIPRIADEWPADLVVVGARGLGAVGRLVLGSVSTAVVHAADCPVLVVKQRRRALRKLVIAVDGSADSLDAVRFVASLPLDPMVVVRLVAVVERPYVPRSAPGIVVSAINAAVADIVAERRGEVERVLAGVEKELDGKVGAVERVLAVGRPADEILAEANDPDVDLVVVGARGLGAVKRLVLGSVSERVLRDAECAVLVVKGGGITRAGT
jgi:nucleotide-binding universal stress UspA family protein